jgi:hypothetical protein
MKGKPVRLEEVRRISLKDDSEEGTGHEGDKGPTKSGRVIPFKKTEEKNN